MTLTEFLLARIAEDEAAARNAGGGAWESWSHRAGSLDLRDLVEDRKRFAEVPEDRDEHIVRWSPARVRAECEAKRAIVDLALSAEHAGQVLDGALINGALAALALPYADHPDYDPEWSVRA